MATTAVAWHLERHRCILHCHPEVRALMRPDAWSGAAILVVGTIQMVLAVELRAARWTEVLLAAYFVGALLSHGLGVLIHEAAHNLISRRTWVNKLWAAVANVPLVAPAAIGFRFEHLLHHRYLGDAGGLDTQAPTRAEARFVGSSAVLKMLSFTFGRFLFRGRPAARVPRDGWLILNLATQIAAMVPLTLYAGPRALVYLVVSALAAFGPHPLGARRLSEHLPVRVGQPTNSYYGILNWLSFNVGLHVEHHDFPAVPWRHLPRLRSVAREHYEHLFGIRSWTLLLAQYFFNPRYRVHHYIGMGPFLDDESTGNLPSLGRGARGAAVTTLALVGSHSNGERCMTAPDETLRRVPYPPRPAGDMPPTARP